jgi:glucose-6-phosphate isomerase
MADVAPLKKRPAWATLEAQHSGLADRHLRELFDADPGRGEALTLEALGLYLDYSKQRINTDTVAALVELAEQSGLRDHIDAMFRG